MVEVELNGSSLELQDCIVTLVFLGLPFYSVTYVHSGGIEKRLERSLELSYFTEERVAAQKD